MIALMLTGGTIDKKYNELTGALEHSTTHIEEILKQARNTADIQVRQLMLIDSLDMTGEQRQEILEACKNEAAERIILTHGTDSMVETATLLGQNIADKTIVLFGSMIPFSFGGSDAEFNLGCAVTAVQTLPAGVYITMNGKIFSWDNVVKDLSIGQFKQKN